MSPPYVSAHMEPTIDTIQAIFAELIFEQPATTFFDALVQNAPQSRGERQSDVVKSRFPESDRARPTSYQKSSQESPAQEQQIHISMSLEQYWGNTPKKEVSRDQIERG